MWTDGVVIITYTCNDQSGIWSEDKIGISNRVLPSAVTICLYTLRCKVTVVIWAQIIVYDADLAFFKLHLVRQQ